MQSENLEHTLSFPENLKTFLWVNDTISVFSLFNGDFCLFDISKPKPIQFSREKVYSALFLNEKEEKIYCGGLFTNTIEKFDFNKQIFESLYNEGAMDKKFKYLLFSIKNDKTLVSLVKKAKKNFVQLLDFRQSSPLLMENELLYDEITAFDSFENKIAVAWKHEEIYSHTIIDSDLIWLKEKAFSKALKQDFSLKKQPDDKFLDQKITSIRLAPSKNYAALGRENGAVSVYEIKNEEGIVNHCKLLLITHSHPPEKAVNKPEPGKLPERKNNEVCDIDFFPMKSEKEQYLVSSGDEGNLKFIDFQQRKLVKKWEIQQEGIFEGGFFEKVRWNPNGNVIMAMKSPNKKGENSGCCLKFVESPIKLKNP